MTASDDLLLSGGGSVAVATDALFGAVADLRQLAGHAEATGLRVAALPPVPGVDAAGSAADVADAARSLRGAAERADQLAAALQRSAESYGELELRALRLSRAYEGVLADRVGAWLPALLLPLLPAASAGAAGAALAAMLHPEGAERTAGSAAAGLRRHGRVLTDPLLVALLRSLMLSVDDFAGGMLRAPPGVVRLLGEEGLDVLGLTGSAYVLASLGTRSGLLRESAVEVRRTRRTAEPAPPRGFRDRVDRLPTGPSQIRIERYSSSTGPDRFEVFLGGTRAAGLLGGDEPWDMTSNLHAVAELSPGSLRATEEAMRRSGITAGSEVVFTGYSQGGLLATRLAASGEWNTQGLVTFGAPVAGMEMPAAVPVVQVEHTDDLVPALGGDRIDRAPIVVRREAFAAERDVPPDVPVPAHRLSEYRSTAELLDGARTPAVTAAAARLHAFGSGAERIEVTLYRADRVAKE